MLSNCYIFDIDGTLADCTHRLHHLERRDYAAFYSALSADTPIAPVIYLLRCLCDRNWIMLVSGRPEEHREATETWLRSNMIHWDALYMRSSGDFRPDHVVKKEILEKMKAEGWNPILAIDDRPSVIEMWRENGVFCLAAPWHGNEKEKGPMGELHLMVGPSGAGKTRWCEKTMWCNGKAGYISSDRMRMDLLGDFKDQTQNARVFSAIHDIAQARLRHGLPTLIDATHLRRRDRLAAVALTTGPVIYHVVNRSLEAKIRDRGWRSEELVRKHDQMFRSQEKEIMAGDGVERVRVEDHRE